MVIVPFDGHIENAKQKPSKLVRGDFAKMTFPLDIKRVSDKMIDDVPFSSTKSLITLTIFSFSEQQSRRLSLSARGARHSSLVNSATPSVVI